MSPFPIRFRDGGRALGGKNVVRVWRNDWAGDQFEVLTLDELADFQRMLARLSIYMVEMDDCDD